MRIGVLTGGGDCPGLNAVIRAVVRKGVATYGHEFVGFRDGWKGPLEGLTKPLGIAEVRGILPRGGTILGSSRTNPFKIEAASSRSRRTWPSRASTRWSRSAARTPSASRPSCTSWACNVVGVPKTIDNDLNATDYTFGFDTAVNIAMEAIDRLHTTAESHHRTLVVEVMGRHAGWIALHAGLAGGANVILLPEREFDVEQVADYVEKRFQHRVLADRRGRRGRAAARRPDGHCTTRSSTPSGTSASAASASGSPSSSRSKTGKEARTVVLGHIQRGGTPTAFDRVLATRFGLQAIDAVHEGDCGKMVALRGTDIVRVPLAEAHRRAEDRPARALRRGRGLLRQLIASIGGRGRRSARRSARLAGPDARGGPTMAAGSAHRRGDRRRQDRRAGALRAAAGRLAGGAAAGHRPPPRARRGAGRSGTASGWSTT